MAMTKLGYNRGLFVTSAKISPQAKREYLNDYPDIILDFLDGGELAKEVLANGMLTALWWEGSRFSEVNVSTVFPLIVRCHHKDAPFSPFRTTEKQDASTFF